MAKEKDAAEQVAQAAMAAFEPLVKLFLDLGVSSPEAETLLRAVYVHETHRLLLERDLESREVSHSKVSMLSGVHRNTVSQIMSGGGPKISYSRDQWSQRADRVLRAWHSDADYMDDRGVPLRLRVRDTDSQRPTFWTLCSKYAPSIWPATILDELVRIEAVRRKKNQEEVEVLRYAYGDANARVAALEQLGARTRDLLSTLIHNLDTAPQGQRVVETIENVDVDPEFAKVLRRMFKDRAEAHTTSMDSELNSGLASRKGNGEEKRLRMGMTIYAFEGPAQADASISRIRRPVRVQKSASKSKVTS